MALDEAMRHRIHDGLERLLGSEEAAALMATLPPDDLTTKADLLPLKTDVQLLKADIQHVQADVQHVQEMLTLEIRSSCAELGSTLRAEMNQQYRFMLQWVTGAMLAAGSLGIAAGHLLS